MKRILTTMCALTLLTGWHLSLLWPLNRSQ